MKDWRRSPELPSMMGTAALMPGSNSSQTTQNQDMPSREASQNSPLKAQEGVSAQTTLPVRTKLDVSLAEMARRVIIQRIHLFDTLGDAPFRLVRPILEQCHPKKLWILEENSPQYIEETDSIWERNCMRDFRDLGKDEKERARKSTGGWRLLYMRKMNEDRENREAATLRAKERYAALKADKQASRVQVMQELPASKRRKGLLPAGGVGGRNAGSRSGATMASASASMSQGQRMMHKARRQSQLHIQATRTTASSVKPLPSSSALPRPAGTKPGVPAYGSAREQPQHDHAR